MFASDLFQGGFLEEADSEFSNAANQLIKIIQVVKTPTFALDST